jgi:hypothetical protein
VATDLEPSQLGAILAEAVEHLLDVTNGSRSRREQPRIVRL